jgi:N-acetylmuramoyl-L-alanine amidase
MKVGIIVGHKANAPGACNKKYGVCEYQFNDQVACDIYDYLKVDAPGLHPVIIRRRTYKTLPDDVNNLNPAFAISLHCNALNEKINGTETLYYHKSGNGKKLATYVQNEILKAFGFRDLGIKPTTVEDRGGHLLKYTNMPVVIAEPFFIDVDEAFEKVSKLQPVLVQAYATAIIRFANLLSGNLNVRGEIGDLLLAKDPDKEADDKRALYLSEIETRVLKEKDGKIVEEKKDG